MKKIIAICLFICVLLSCFPVAADDFSDDKSISKGCNTLDSSVTFYGNQQLVSNTSAAIVYEVSTDSIIYAYNADLQVAPSSLVKILTALITLENCELSEVVTVKGELIASLSVNAAAIGLEADEVISVESLLYCMLVSSANDAALVLADHVMGGHEEFVAEMNKYAAKLGCTGTNFTNSHGLHNDDQYTTVRDITKIIKEAIKNETLLKMMGTVYYTVPSTNKSYMRYLTSYNYFINNDSTEPYYDRRVLGGRTGVADDGSRCIATVAEDGGMTLISVVTGARSIYEGENIKVTGGYSETQQLMDMAFGSYKPAQILFPNQILKQSSVFGAGNDLSIGTYQSAFSVLPNYIDADDLVYRYIDEPKLSLPIQKGQIMSRVEVWCENVCVAQADTYAMNSVNAASQNNDNGEQNDKVNILSVVLYILGATFGIILLGFIVLSTVRAARLAKVRRRYRRNSRNRRRSR